MWSHLVKVAVFCIPGIMLSAVSSFAEETGILLEEVERGSTLEMAGLRPGDQLLKWSLEASESTRHHRAEGQLSSYVDWMSLTREYAPLGCIDLIARRDGVAIRFSISPGIWEGIIRPVLPPDILPRYLNGLEHRRQGDLMAAVAVWNDIAVNNSD